MVLNLLAPNAPDRYFETPEGRQHACLGRRRGRLRSLRIVDEWQNVAVEIEAPRREPSVGRAD